MTWNLESYPTTVLNESIWHFRGSEHTLTTPTYFQGVKIPQPLDNTVIYDTTRPTATAAPATNTTFGFDFTGLFIRRSLQVKQGLQQVAQRRTFGDCWREIYLQVGCSSCHPDNGVTALKEEPRDVVGGLHYCTKPLFLTFLLPTSITTSSGLPSLTRGGFFCNFSWSVFPLLMRES